MLRKMFDMARALRNKAVGFVGSSGRSSAEPVRKDPKVAARRRAQATEKTLNRRALYVSTRMALGKSFFSKRLNPRYRAKLIRGLTAEELKYAIEKRWVRADERPR